ncbi:helix-turn-helix transcriptional regulator [uncultured Acetatifactor sp.]|uniref:helix-turn-helix domain-containing protein n=1 Tax=uncultured Acetatifactor sp. TaxID=1671927 RepID=UPI0026395C27|nr:helix-turn-helix transcriptional regulator [uncultured Acetatifactor sp.]
MYEIFARLLEERNLKAADVCKGTGLPSSLFSEWKRGKSTPKADKIKKIADFFGVSAEYLMTGEENTQIYYTNEETAKLAQEMFEDEDMRSLFHMKRTMPPERFKAHMEFMKNLYNQEKGEDF